MKVRPSELVLSEECREEAPMLALSVDRAVVTFGDALRSELESAKGKNEQQVAGKRQQILMRWLPELRKTQKQFRDPADVMKRR